MVSLDLSLSLSWILRSHARRKDKDESQRSVAMKDVALFVVNHIGANDKVA
jgi:hypothetical protein